MSSTEDLFGFTGLVQAADTQQRLSSLVRAMDEPGFDPTLICGLDAAYANDSALAVAAVWDLSTRRVVEIAEFRDETTVDYRPGFFGFREGRLLAGAVARLDSDPDTLLVDGHGIAHPRRFGLACHVGLALNKTTIGVAKSHLYGTIEGETLVDTDRTIIGRVMTRKNGRPYYVSVGHKISLNKAVELIERSADSNYPVPLQIAHSEALRLREKIQKLKPEHLLALYKLSEMGATDQEVICSTSDLAKGIGTSQQTASRRLIEMEKLHLIERTRTGRDQKLKITGDGYRELSEMFLNLKRVFEAPKKDLVITGTVFTGLKEGSYYMSRDGYRKQFISKLGFDPFPGTLNLKVNKENLKERKKLETYPSVYIEGFANENRTYGPAKCFRALVNDEVKCAIVMPIRAHYGEDVVELIAPVSLRKKFDLADGASVRVRVPIGP